MAKTFAPHDYQQEALDHLYQTPRAALWAPMGGGKTAVTLTALENLSLIDDVYPALVLAPLRVVNTVWPLEFEKWTHTAHLRVVLVTGSRAEREAALRVPADIYCCTYDNLVWLVEHFKGKWPFKTVVADELSRLRSFRIRQGGKRAGALGKVAHTLVNRFIGLTGTPAPKGLVSLWGQTWFLDKGERLGKTFSAFEHRWFRKSYDGFSLEPFPHAQAEIENLLKDICLTVKGLPVEEPIVTPIYVDLPPQARAIYNQMEKEAFALIDEFGVESVNAGAKINRLLQIANGAIYVEDTEWREVHKAKIEALESVVEEAAGMPVLASYSYKHDLARLLKHFKGSRVLDADPQTVKDWNDGKIPMLLAHPACLHPATEVLTETRGWVKIVDVSTQDRVFDGVEFVRHAGCRFSGTKHVIEAFGLTLTPDHKLLVGGEWVEAKHVRHCRDSRRKAYYSYAGDDSYLSEMLPLRGHPPDTSTKCTEGQPTAERALCGVHRRHFSSDDGNQVLVYLERHERPRHRSEQPRLRSVRRGWSWHLGRVDVLREFLSRHVSELRGWFDHRAHRQLERVLQRQLPMGYEYGAAVQQTEQQSNTLPRARHAPRGVLPGSGREPWRDYPSPESRTVGGSSVSGLRSINVQKRPSAAYSEVYDLVNCGPRGRFLVRNGAGEVFISHNSAGHGLNLQDGGNILARFGLGWDLELHMQILERIGPQRQKQAGYDRPVFDYPIIARDTIEERATWPSLTEKRSRQEMILAAMRRS